MAKKISPYLKTLRHVPDEIILSMGTREFGMALPHSCICGWALRESFTLLEGVEGTESVYYNVFAGGNAGQGLANRFGGNANEWDDIFLDVCHDANIPAIEEAFVDRVLECVGS